MAIAIAEIASTGADLRDERSLDYIVERWHWWSRTATDIGVQTRAVLSAAAEHGISAQTARGIGCAASQEAQVGGQRLAYVHRPGRARIPA